MAKTDKQRSAPASTKPLTGDVARAVRAALEKKALDVVVLDLRNTPAFTDFFVLCSGQTQRQVKAIADSVEEALRAARVKPAHVEGYDRAEWILMDFFTFIVHVFTPQTRAFYSLERLWGDAERIEVSDEHESQMTTPRSRSAARDASPSRDPSRAPSRDPSRGPSRDPSRGPSRDPSRAPSRDPSRGRSRDLQRP